MVVRKVYHPPVPNRLTRWHLRGAGKASGKEGGDVDSNFSSAAGEQRVWAGYLVPPSLTGLPSQKKGFEVLLALPNDGGGEGGRG